jgi:hypothetical protein
MPAPELIDTGFEAADAGYQTLGLRSTECPGVFDPLLFRASRQSSPVSPQNRKAFQPSAVINSAILRHAPAARLRYGIPRY